MADVKWCVKCKKELGGTDTSLAFLGLSSGSGFFCKDNKCERYGLITVFYLEEQKKAPTDLKSNDLVKEE